MKNVENVTNINAEEIIEENILQYAQYVLLSRAIPSLEDGMKPVHRRILYTMHKHKIFGLTKSMRIEGLVSAYHPHGGSYPAMVGMTQLDAQINQPITGKGNFAQHTSRDLQEGAPRYTEAKLSPYGLYLLEDVDRKGVNFVPNYDGTEMIPEFLPIKFPAILVNSSHGIGVGFASHFMPLNLGEVVDAMEKYIRTGEKDLLYPDFSTGGKVFKDDESVAKIMRHGNGTLTMMGSAEIVKGSIMINEIPYATTREAIIDAIIKHSKDKLKEVRKITDLTGYNRMGIQIDLKRGADAEAVLEKIKLLTPFVCNESANQVTVFKQLPKQMGTYEIMNNWIGWRMEVIKKGIKYKVTGIQKELNVLSGFVNIVNNNLLDDIIALIRKEPAKTLVKTMMEKYDFNEEQALYIINMQLKNINNDYIQKRLDGAKALREEADGLLAIYKSDELLAEEVIKGAQDAKKKFGQPRRTEIIEREVKGKNSVLTKVIEDYKTNLIVTKGGYIYKSRRLGEGDIKLKDGDKVLYVNSEAYNRGELVFFNNEDKSAYKIKLDDIEEITSKNSLGVFAKSLTTTKDFSLSTYFDNETKYFLMQYDDRKTALIDAQSFATTTARKQVKNALSKKANLLSVSDLKCDVDVTVSSDFKDVTFNTKDELAKAKGSQGRFVNKTGKKFIGIKINAVE